MNIRAKLLCAVAVSGFAALTVAAPAQALTMQECSAKYQAAKTAGTLGGQKWNDVSKNVTGMPAWGVVSKIEPSHFNGGTAYIAVDAHLMDSREPYIFKTTDYGATWKRVSGDLPNRHPLSYVKAVAENPNKQGQLFAGTGHGFFHSSDDGAHWAEIFAGLPKAPVSWVVVQKQFHDVVVSTYGRGIYVLDDITPLEQTTAATTDAALHLFTPRPAFPGARPRAGRRSSAWPHVFRPRE